MKRTLSSAAIALSLTLAPTIGCSKKDENSTAQKAASLDATQPLLNDPLLKKLPASTAGFVVFDFTGDGYQQFKNSPWGKEAHGLSAIKAAVDEMKANGVDDDQAKLAETALQSVQKLGLVSADGTSQVDKVVARDVSFLEVLKDQPIPFNIGSYAQAASGADLSERIPVLKKLLSDAGMTVTDDTVGPAKGLVAKAQKTEPEDPDLAIYAAATKDLFGISLTRASLEPLFASSETNTLKELQALPEFQKAESSVRGSGAPLSFAFLSVKKLGPALDAIAAEGAENADFKPSEAPISAVALAQGFSGQMVTLASVATSPSTDSQKNFVTAFENSSLPTNAFKVPGDTAFSLSLDARLLSKLESFTKTLSDPSAGAILNQIKSVQGLTFGVRPGDGTSPLPDIFVSIESSARDSVASSVESGLGLGMMAAGQQLQWLSKDISGSPTRYFMTMLGVGVYVSSPKNGNTLLIANSEKMISDSVAASTGESSLDSVMPKVLRDRMVPSTVGALYLNFPRIAAVVDSVKGTVGMMLGTNDDLDQSLNSAKLKGLGIGLGSISYADGVFRLQSTFERTDISK
jgi:hypothetical protein